MQNISTDLLRTLIAVVDLRSFTRAAKALGLTQPAVSSQIKRLQSQLGYELLDKRLKGVNLTPRGESVVQQARRLLSVNDEIVLLTGGTPTRVLRVGIPGDYGGSRLPASLARFRMRGPAVSFIVVSDTSDNMLRDLRKGDLDVVMAVTETAPPIPPRHCWRRQAVWVRSDATRLDPGLPVPLVCYGEDCASQRVAVAALAQAGRDCEFVFTSKSHISLAAAVAAGFGVLVMPSERALRDDVRVWEDPPLPKLPQLYCGIYVRDGGNRQLIEELADHLAEIQVEPRLPKKAAVAAVRTSRGDRVSSPRLADDPASD
jgi:DNA-binding transcriptional LysR family regulator